MRTVLVVGHEPTMSETAASSRRRAPEHGALALVRSGVPTATYAVLEVRGGWDGLRPRRSARLVRVRPGRRVGAALSGGRAASRTRVEAVALEGDVGGGRARSGLALNAIPKPAAAIMSRSLAPSPMAIVRSSGDARRRGELAQRRGLGGAVDDRPGDPAGEARRRRPPAGSPGCSVIAELGRERLDDLVEAAGDQPDGPAARRPARRRSSPAPGRELDLGAARRRSTDAGQAGEGRDALVQRRREVELAAHRPLGDAVTAARGRRASASSSMTSPVMNVESTSMHDEATVGRRVGRTGSVRARARRRPVRGVVLGCVRPRR